jgi:AraC-like DNA-binding protein
MSINLSEFILYFSIIQSFFLAFYFFSTKLENRLSNRILGVSLLIYGLFVLSTTLYYDWLFGLAAYRLMFFNLRELFYLSLFVLLYFYIKSLMIKQFSIWQKINILHLIPLLIVVCYLHFILKATPFETLIKSGFFLRLCAFNLAFNIFYVSLTFFVIKQRYGSFYKFFSKVTNPNYKWLSFFIGCFIVLWLCDLVVCILGVIHKLLAYLPIVSTTYTLIPFIFINTILLIVLLAPKLYIFKKNGNGHSKNGDEQKELLNRLLILLDKEKIFTDPELSLQKVSTLLKVSHKVLSAVINDKLGQSFTDLINNHRIKEGKTLLVKYPEKTVQEIMYEIGYNSKSAFNLHFKSSTGLTPKEFRSKCQSKPANLNLS